MNFMDRLTFSEYDEYLWRQGTHAKLYEFLGAKPHSVNGVTGFSFSVWAPKAQEIFVVGDFNHWQTTEHPMQKNEQGIWYGFVAGAKLGQSYKFLIHGANGKKIYKADPFALWTELRPKNSSVLVNIDDYIWGDQEWQSREMTAPEKKAMLIYELHLGSWRTKTRIENQSDEKLAKTETIVAETIPEENNNFLSYREIAEQLPDYAKKMGYTHIEILPVAEHPLDASWGYQITGYFSPTSRYGTPQEFMFFVDKCHQAGIGVIMDWVPAHFCKDDQGLREFDGTYLYEPEHELRRDNHGWGTSYFDVAKGEVRSFLLSNACYWMDKYHLDGLRVDAVASMLYYDYERENWLPNDTGGRENFDAIQFFRQSNKIIFELFPKTLMIAEESTAFPMVTWPTHDGGLGFNFKWNMGWMHDVLKYMSLDPLERGAAHNLLTFSFMYCYSENFVLPFSHDEVVHGKFSIFNKMHGDYWQKFASLRLLYGYMMMHPGKKLNFMGQELGQIIEWDEKRELDWFLLKYPIHDAFHNYIKDLNTFYKEHSCLWEQDPTMAGLDWISADDNVNSILSFARYNSKGEYIIMVCNFQPRVQEDYAIGVNDKGVYKVIFNSDLEIYNGSEFYTRRIVLAQEVPLHNKPCSIVLQLPPLAMLCLKLDYKIEEEE